MDRSYGFNGFTLDYYFVFHDDVCSEPQFKVYFLILGRDAALYVYTKSASANFVCKSGLVHSLQKSWPKCFMDLKGTIYNDLCDLVLMHVFNYQ